MTTLKLPLLRGDGGKIPRKSKLYLRAGGLGRS